ncbi:MAG: hypothetical protein ACE5K7_01400, partial [Phycisphaerae bacterium]
CGLVRPASNRLSLRSLSLTGALLVAALALAMSQVQHLAALLVLVTANGMMMALFWPPVMGWISAGRHGQLLN